MGARRAPGGPPRAAGAGPVRTGPERVGARESPEETGRLGDARPGPEVNGGHLGGCVRHVRVGSDLKEDLMGLNRRLGLTDAVSLLLKSRETLFRAAIFWISHRNGS